jgi:hypothetical protein
MPYTRRGRPLASLRKGVSSWSGNEQDEELAHDEVCYFGSLGVRHRDCVRSRDPASSRRSMLAGLHELLRTVIPIHRITCLASSVASRVAPLERSLTSPKWIVAKGRSLVSLGGNNGTAIGRANQSLCSR